MSVTTMTSAEVREKLVEALVLDLIGPIADPSRETERLDLAPSRWYLTGFLVTRKRSSKKSRKSRDLDDENDLFSSEDDPLDDPTAETVPLDDSDKNAAPPAARRQLLPSSMGLSVLVPRGTRALSVTVRWGDYIPDHPEPQDEPDDAPDDIEPENSDTPDTPEADKQPAAEVWTRRQREEVIKLDLTGDFPRSREVIVPDSGGLRINWLSRPAPDRALDVQYAPDGAETVNVYLVNLRDPRGGASKDISMAFQAELILRAPGGFTPRPNLRGLHSRDDDERIADLQYSDACEFAVGHNVSAVAAVGSNGHCTEVRTAWIPSAEVERVEPVALDGVVLDMEALASLADASSARTALQGLVTQYRAWIQARRETVATLHFPRRVEVGQDLLNQAEQAADRVARGIALLDDPRVLRAFTLANAAMAMQARRREAQKPGSTPETVPPPQWRPFQLAFVLLNLESIVHPDSDDRRTVELLYFPTGGGKTEAYLGLAAFTLIYRRLREGVSSAIPKYAGVTVLMRYTLRLLTLDQLSRATALICALELLRRDNPQELGTWRFEIGLWVGSAATPNFMGKPGQEEGMVSRVLEYQAGRTSRPPVPLQQCPWCGAPFTRDRFLIYPNRDHARELRITCPGDACEFHGDNHLPIHLVDDSIYRRLPCFLIATVDKFAAMPWKGQVAKLFGRVSSFDRGAGFLGPCDDEEGIEVDDLPPPELIIQDELHLISGPLGTIAGLYETAIDWLCHDRQEHGPKIVSSTATVRRAREQIQALFATDRVQIFPPPGPDRRDSFFSKTVPAAQVPARLYLGVAAQGRSAKRVLVKTYLALMSAAQKLYQACGGARNPNNPADPYMTMLGYFNSLRELGGTRRLVEDELTTRLKQYGKRRRIGEDESDSAFANREIGYDVRELTSRYSTDKVAEAKDALNRPFGLSGSVDVALATNMISVGLDISRLGLMAVFAQPKLTSEYIQSTSRVGRDRKKPGLIVTIFNINRSRDRSHYERFRFFHESFYRGVEATSVTPFSPRALDRALAAVTVALARLGHDPMIRNAEAKEIVAHADQLDQVAEVLARRAACQPQRAETGLRVDPESIRAKVRELLQAWHGIATEQDETNASLCYEAGRAAKAQSLLREMLDTQVVELDASKQLFKAPRSMRDVEATTAIIPRRYGQPKGSIKIKNVRTTISSLRQSQFVTTYGPGSMIDLPWFAAVLSGLDDWEKGERIVEPRLEEKVKTALGRESIELRTPKAEENRFEAPSDKGVVAWRFPGWSLTQDTMKRTEPNGSTYETRLMVRGNWIDPGTGLYRGADFRYSRAEKDHHVVPIRFIRACKNGHMGEIDWEQFVHRDEPRCGGDLWLDDLGTTGELTELRVRCECGRFRFVSEAAGFNNPALGRCDGNQSWLGHSVARESCNEQNRLLIRTASNAYFPQKVSVISLPDRGGELQEAIGKAWEAYLSHVNEPAMLQAFRRVPQVAAALEGFRDDEVYQAIEARRAGQAVSWAGKIKEAEFELLACGQKMIGTDEFDGVFHAVELEETGWSREIRAEPWLERVLIVHRLREVLALVGYTRFDYISPDIDGELDLGPTSAKLGVNASWVPAVENKGEGLFLQFNARAIADWWDRIEVKNVEAGLQRGQVAWNNERDRITNRVVEAPYVMLHTLSHLLMNAISLECGYPASSIKERIYARSTYGYGILLYTASSDSHGTLGGLAEAARSIEYFLRVALELGQLCSNDPVCSQHEPEDRNERRYLHGAACHGCVLVSETSCETFNDFLDRSLVVPTVACLNAEFFRAW